MKVVFVSNYYNHHQHALSIALDKITKGNYTFVATSEMRQERKKLGYGMEEIPAFVKCVSDDPVECVRCLDLIEAADVVMIGAAPEKLVSKRIRDGKLTFRYTERIFKRSISVSGFVRRWMLLHLKNPPGKPLYLLAAGSFTASDYGRFGLFREKAYQWGYFPELLLYSSVDDLMRNKSKNTILWAGRFLEWKHPEQALEIGRRLKKDGINFTMNLIGTGGMEEYLRKKISEYKLWNCVHMLGSMKPECVRAHMEKSEIFLFTSDRNEGWGAVLNEAMNSGCAVLASHAIGSVPSLIKHGVNGLIHRSDDMEMLYANVRYLLEHPQERIAQGRNAYETIRASWNAEIAAQRFCVLASRILQGEEFPEICKDGPCSKAEIMYDDWM